MKVGVIGATGIVGQRFVQLLQGHPVFELTEVVASERSAGKTLSEACRHKIGPMPESVAAMEVKGIGEDLNCELVFSALPSSVAGRVEKELARRGLVVASNASSHRMDKDVPLIIPEVNPEHLQLIEVQKRKRKTDGFIVTNPNCTTIQLVLALKPLHDAFTLEKVNVVSMQALSGAGYPGVASMSIIDNILPYIGGEEEKIEDEPLKLLGTVQGDGVVDADIVVSASCNRVNVSDGHLECVSVKLKEKTDVDSIKEVMRNFRALPQELKLPSAPEQPVVVMEEDDRPQPKLDRNIEKGMACVVGRVREDTVLDFKFLVLGHNTIRGAAGASILNAELLHAQKYIEEGLK